MALGPGGEVSTLVALEVARRLDDVTKAGDPIER
jgi:hypothetical protein